MARLKKIALFISVVTIVAFSTLKNNFPKSFVNVSEVIPNLKIEMRYATKHNFVGKRINGYYAENCYLTKEAAKALEKVSLELEENNLCLYIYDSYRPQKAVNHFVTWARDRKDTLMKNEFYPSVLKKNLFKKGYISSKSRHSSGSTIDLTLFSDETNSILDMGSAYDFFGEESAVMYEKITKKQQENRMLLQKVMKNNGFRSYSKEWWHFTLRYEPYRNQYFDFDIK